MTEQSTIAFTTKFERIQPSEQTVDKYGSLRASGNNYFLFSQFYPAQKFRNVWHLRHIPYGCPVGFVFLVMGTR